MRDIEQTISRRQGGGVNKKVLGAKLRRVVFVVAFVVPTDFPAARLKSVFVVPPDSLPPVSGLKKKGDAQVEGDLGIARNKPQP